MQQRVRVRVRVSISVRVSIYLAEFLCKVNIHYIKLILFCI